MAPGCWSTRPPWSRARRTGSARCPARPRAPPASPRGAGAPEDEQPAPAGHPRGPRAPAEPPTVAGRGGRGVRPAGGFVPPVQGGGGTAAGSGVEGQGDGVGHHRSSAVDAELLVVPRRQRPGRRRSRPEVEAVPHRRRRRPDAPHRGGRHHRHRDAGMVGRVRWPPHRRSDRRGGGLRSVVAEERAERPRLAEPPGIGDVGMAGRTKLVGLVAAVALLGLAACTSKTGGTTAGGFSTLAPLPKASSLASASPGTAGSDVVVVSEGESSPTEMFIQLSANQAPAGRVTFFVTNAGKQTHEFVVLQTDTPAANFPLTGFEGETDRFNEDTVGVNVGETGDVPAGESKTLALTLAPGHYALVCNLPGHYRMGMHQDFTVTPSPGVVVVSEGESSPTEMFIQLSANQAPAGRVTFFVTNAGKQTHEFVVLQTDTPAANFPLTGFEGETDRFNEDTVGVNVGETGDVPAGESKTLALTLAPGHYALVCNLPGHYRMGMHQDFTVTPSPGVVVVSEGESSPTEMFIQLSANQAPAGRVTFFVTNAGKQTHEFVVLQTDTPAANFPLTGFEGET